MFTAYNRYTQLGFYWHNERLERTTWNAPCYCSVFCIFFLRLAQWLVYSLFLTFTNPKLPLTWSAGLYKPLTPFELKVFHPEVFI